MGQKVNPKIFRLALTHEWESNWFAKFMNFSDFLQADAKIRTYLDKKLAGAAVAEIKINRSANQIEVVIYTSRPGIIIGRSGSGVEEIKSDIEKQIKDKKYVVKINIQEVSEPDTNAALVGQNIAAQIEKRISWRRAVKQSIDRAKKAGVAGIKVIVGGRLGGVEMARSESFSSGKMPLQVLSAKIDYAFCKAQTTYGVIGIKTWIYKKDDTGKGAK